MNNETILRFTWTLSKLMAFLLFVASCSFDTVLIYMKTATAPETLFKCLPYILALIGIKQGLDGAEKLVGKLKASEK